MIDSNTAAPSEIGDESAPNGGEEELNLDEEDQENDGNQEEDDEKEEDEFPDVQVIRRIVNWGKLRSIEEEDERTLNFSLVKFLNLNEREL